MLVSLRVRVIACGSALLAVAGLASCSSPVAVTAAKGSTPPAVKASPAVKPPPSVVANATVKPPPSVVANAAISGRVVAPAGIVAAGGGNIVAAGGGNIVAGGGGNIVAAGGGNIVAGGGGNATGAKTYQLNAATPEAPLANARVFLADAEGNDLQIASTTTDAEGQYALKAPVGDYVVAVEATGKDEKQAYLRTMVKAVEGSATADVATDTTCVTLALTDGAKGAVTGVDAKAFQDLVVKVRPRLADVPLSDLTERAALLGWMSKFTEIKAELEMARETLEKAAADLKKVAEDTAQKATDDARQKIKDGLGIFGR